MYSDLYFRKVVYNLSNCIFGQNMCTSFWTWANQCANRNNAVIFLLHIDSPHLWRFQILNWGESMCKQYLECYAAFCTLICPKCSWGETMCIQKISSNFLIAHWFAPLASKIIFKWGESMCNKHLHSHVPQKIPLFPSVLKFSKLF